MDYKYIEQLLARYWNGETNLEEEQILKSFFCQHDVPEHLKGYIAYFTNMVDEGEVGVSDDFDSRFSDILDQEDARHSTVKAIVIPFRKRLMPFLKAAASVAVFLTVGGAALRSLSSEDNLQKDLLESPGVFVTSDKVSEMTESIRMRIENEEQVEMAQKEVTDSIPILNETRKID